MVLFDGPVVAAVAAVGLGAVATVLAVAARRLDDDGLSGPPVAPGEVRSGRTTLRGRAVRHRDAVEPTLAGGPDEAVVVEYRVQRRVGDGWETVTRAVESVSFVLADGRDRVVVEATDLRVDQVRLDDPHETVARVTSTAGSLLPARYADRDPGEGARRYVQRAVVPGDELLVSGDCSRRTIVGGPAGATSVYALTDGSKGLIVADGDPGSAGGSRVRVALVGTVAVVFGLLATLAVGDLIFAVAG